MPKGEFDFDDPMELSGVALATEEDTTDAMCECFIEEFMRLGYNARQILALFRNPHYLGMNLVMKKRGEEFVRATIAEIFARWGRPVAAGILPAVEPGFQPGGKGVDSTKALESSESVANSSAHPGGRMPPSSAGETPAATTDPMGVPIPKLIQ